MTRYHEILLVPAVGHFGSGSYDPGPNYGHYFEVDVVQDLLMGLAEELDVERVRCRTLDLWRAPGLTRAACAAETNANTISLHVAFGRAKAKPGDKNSTKTWFSDPGAAWLAKLLSEAVGEWARCSNFYHEICNAKHQPDFFPHHAVLIEPFNLAIDDAQPYLSRIRQLSHSMALVIADYFKHSEQAIRYKPLGAWSNDKKKDPDDKHLVGTFLKALSDGQLAGLERDIDEPKPDLEDIKPLPPEQQPVQSEGGSGRPSGRGKGRRPA